MNTNLDPTTLLGSATSVSDAADTKNRVKTNESVSQNEFLKLFITQLQNQDPMSPMDTEQLTAQLAQFSSLEKLTSIDQQLGKLATKDTSSSSRAEVLSLLGKTVDYDGSTMAVSAGKPAPVTFTLPKDAAEVAVSVRTTDGKLVRTVQLGELAAGEQTFAFDGKDENGQLVKDGNYKVDVGWSTKHGARLVPLSLVSRGVVDGVDLAADQPTLLIGSRRLTLDQVRQVRTAADAS
ncbi:MAG: flagellar hook capping FlgD N-terminal domain-containing protein [Candidatus Binatia bacterium]